MLSLEGCRWNFSFPAGICFRWAPGLDGFLLSTGTSTGSARASRENLKSRLPLFRHQENSLDDYYLYGGVSTWASKQVRRFEAEICDPAKEARVLAALQREF